MQDHLKLRLILGSGKMSRDEQIVPSDVQTRMQVDLRHLAMLRRSTLRGTFILPEATQRAAAGH